MSNEPSPRKATPSAPRGGAGAAREQPVDGHATNPRVSVKPIRIGEGTTWGLVEAYAVDAQRLMIKLNAGAISRLLISLDSEAPHFRTVVAMTVMAHHTGRRLTVRYAQPAQVHAGPLVPGSASSGPEILRAVEVGVGNEFDKALSYEDWPIKLDGNR
jgi:hypothetical protein